MTRARVVLVLTALAMASCGERVCTSGQRRSCVCPDGSQAIQACAPDGQYGACACAGVVFDLSGVPFDLAGANDLASSAGDLASGDLAGVDASGVDLSSADLSSGDLSSGGLPFGAMCAGAGLPGCAAGLFCDRFAMGTVFRCTRMCPGGCDATCCPAPSTGMCNAKGECKFTM
jgi:hypothetical protein